MIKGITYILKNDPAFQTLVGQNAALSKYKAYPVIAPQPELIPYSVCKMTSKTLKHKGASSVQARNTFDVEFMVASYAKAYDDVDAIDNAVIQALVPYSGTVNGVSFTYIELLDSSDDYVEAYGGIFARMTRFTCTVKLTALT
jgi:hypothetical protein